MLVKELMTVELWERERMRELGYSHYEAVQMVDEGYDYHDLCNLLSAGCSRELAKEIARPIQ